MKRRLDQALVEQGLADDLRQAQGLIMAGQVRVAGLALDKPGAPVDSIAMITVKSSSLYVSRAGEKLASVAERFKLDLFGKVVLDVGSSTGGFSDYCLQDGAARVYAVDVGNNQLAYKLRIDPRVVVMERTDIRRASLPEQAEIAVVDVSFVSLTKVLESVACLVKLGGAIIAMAKPQFEADKATADRFQGVISDETVRQQILVGLRDWLEPRFEIVDEADSGLAGTQGNLEHFYLLVAKR